jgi:hypothetical protein
MKTLLTGLFVVLSSSFLHAGTDRFGNVRSEIPRSSFTATANANVQIASAGVTQWESGYGGIVLRYIECSGVDSSTITVFNSMVFDGQSSTATVYRYTPTANGGFSSPYYGSVYISSALSYDKKGLAPCTIGWDYTTMPKFGGVGE